MTCYIIAEAGVAHEGSFDSARALLSTAITAKADAFKIQYFDKDTIKRRDGSWMPWLEPDAVRQLSKDCRAAGLDFIITPHDKWAVDFIDSEDICDRLKIGSGDWHLLTLSKRFLTSKIIISTGMHTDADIRGIMQYFHGISVLHCVSEYPTEPASARLWYMKQLQTDFPDMEIGYSDHTVGTAIPLAAVTMGAKIIEKHITTERNVPGRRDTFVSLTHKDFIQFVKDVRAIECAMSKPSIRGLTSEEQKTKEWVMKSRGLTLDTWR